MLKLGFNQKRDSLEWEVNACVSVRALFLLLWLAECVYGDSFLTPEVPALCEHEQGVDMVVLHLISVYSSLSSDSGIRIKKKCSRCCSCFRKA